MSHAANPICTTQSTLDLVFNLFHQQRKVSAMGPFNLWPLSPGLCLAVSVKTVRWCTVSTHEASKCSRFSQNMRRVVPADGPHVVCVKRTSYLECIKAIAVSHCCLKESRRKPIPSLSFSGLILFIASVQHSPHGN